MGSFESQIHINILLAFFIPSIVYLADAVGTQTETVVVRGLSLGVPMRRMVSRELLSGLAIGVTLAAVAGPLVLVALGRHGRGDFSRTGRVGCMLHRYSGCDGTAMAV